MSKIVTFVLVILAALTAALPVGAQGGRLPDDQQAMVDRVLAAITATESYTSFTGHAVETVGNTMTIQMGGSASTAEDTYTIEQTTRYTTGEDGHPNTNTLITAHVSSLAFGSAGHVQYTLQAETRGVDEVLYVNVQREADAQADLPAMPEGWVIVQDANEWPALRVLQLGDRLLNLNSPDLFAESIRLLLKEATSATQAAGTLDDGTPVAVITLTLTGHDLRRGLGDYMAAKRPSPSSAVYYGGIDLDISSWTMVFSLNDQDLIMAFTVDTTVVWTAFDINTMSPQTPKGTLLDQTTTLQGTYQISGINAPLEPVAAPEMTAG